MTLRHEWKHEISVPDLIALRERLGAVMTIDSHAINGLYHIKSLYFDSPNDKALREKIDSCNDRIKFRIRLYNNDTSFIHLEKKSKKNSLSSKVKAALSAVETQKIIDGDIEWLLDAVDRPLLQEFYCRMRAEGLKPKTIVEYTREAYAYEPGNTRVTLDYDIRTSIRCTDLLNPNSPTLAAGDAPIVLEVKWDEYLPDIIKDCVQLVARRSAAFSKYAAGRVFG